MQKKAAQHISVVSDEEDSFIIGNESFKLVMVMDKTAVTITSKVTRMERGQPLISLRRRPPNIN